MKNRNLWSIFFFLLLVCSSENQSFGQDSLRREIHIQANVHYGVVMPEYQFVNSISNAPIKRMEISLIQQTRGNDFWQQIYRYPKIGVSFLYTELGNPAVLGNEFAICPYFVLTPIARKHFLLESQLGLGFGYVTKTFDLESNYTDVAVGSHINLHLSYKIGAEIILSNKFSFHSGISFNHFSNANLKEPNLGINTLSLYSGFSWLPGKKQERIRTQVPEFKKGNEFAFIYATGGKHTRALQSTIYFTSSWSFEYKRKARHKFQYGIGADLFYDSSTKKEMSIPGKAAYKPMYDFRSGIHFSQEFIYKHFSFSLQEGIYLGLTDHVDHSYIYNRAIIRYKWSPHFFTHISMKSHLHILDYPEVGFAYYFVK